MKRVVITGATGSIGVALIEQLLEHDIQVVAVVRKDSMRKKNIPSHVNVKIVELNLDRIKELPEILKQYGIGTCDVFYHFGWDGTFGNSRNNVQGQLKNIRYTLDTAEVAAQIGCKKFIGAGSQAEYGRVDGIKLDALTPAFPENGYGMAKLCAGQMSRLLCEQLNIQHIWTRILSVYGPYDGDHTLIMSVIRKLLKNEEPLLTPGEQQWDYLYSKDAGLAMYLLGKNGLHGKTYCIGSGNVKTIREYVEILKENIETSAEVGWGGIPYSEKQVMYLCANIDALCNDTGFEPLYSFERGIKETIEWYKEQNNEEN